MPGLVFTSLAITFSVPSLAESAAHVPASERGKPTQAGIGRSGRPWALQQALGTDGHCALKQAQIHSRWLGMHACDLAHQARVKMQLMQQKRASTKAELQGSPPPPPPSPDQTSRSVYSLVQPSGLLTGPAWFADAHAGLHGLHAFNPNTRCAA
eukprot:357381-Chlamydomonas_euryale.AAC.20